MTKTIERLQLLIDSNPWAQHSVRREGELYYVWDNDVTLTVEGRNIFVNSELADTMHEGCDLLFDDIEEAYKFFCSASMEDSDY